MRLFKEVVSHRRLVLIAPLLAASFKDKSLLAVRVCNSGERGIIFDASLGQKRIWMECAAFEQKLSVLDFSAGSQLLH